MASRLLFGVLLGGVLAAALAVPYAPVRAESDVQAERTDEGIESTVKSLKRTERSDEKVQTKLKTLEQQHEELEFRRRTGSSRSSERSLRHDLRRNEQQQGWEKREGRRLDYESQRQQQDYRNQRQDWRRR
jgi:septal ring factor EnvC (AmiA/AmiB activator)